jgi:hypothetical protein
MSEMSNYVEEFNVLYAALVSGEIDEGEFRRTAIMRFGYTNDEISLIARRVRRGRSDRSLESAGSTPSLCTSVVALAAGVLGK